MRKQKWKSLQCIPTSGFGESLCWEGGLQVKVVGGREKMEGRQPTERPHRALGSEGPLGLEGFPALLAGEREDPETPASENELL